MLRKKLQEQQIAALKSQDKERLSVIRMLISEIKNKEIEKKAELDDEEVIAVLKKFSKELKESIEAFTKGGRADLAEKSQKELAVVSSYLPPEISDDELKKEIESLIAANKTIFDSNKKALIGICMKNLKSKADSSRIMKMLSTYIS